MSADFIKLAHNYYCHSHIIIVYVSSMCYVCMVEMSWSFSILVSFPGPVYIIILGLGTRLSAIYVYMSQTHSALCDHSTRSWYSMMDCNKTTLALYMYACHSDKKGA